MGKAVYVGTVVAGSNQEEAITSFLRTVNSSENNKKRLYSISESSNRVFLTSTENIVKPISPITGKIDTKLISSNRKSIASSLDLKSTSEITASENFSLLSSVCTDCDSVLVANSKSLLSHCIVCGTKQDMDIEESENIRLSITDDEDLQNDEEYVEDVSDEEIKAMMDEEEDEDEEDEEEDEIDEDELDSLMSEEEEEDDEEEDEIDEDEDEDIDEDELDSLMSDEDEEDEIDEDELDSLMSEEEDEEEEDEDEIDEDELDSLMADEDEDDYNGVSDAELDSLMSEEELDVDLAEKDLTDASYEDFKSSLSSSNKCNTFNKSVEIDDQLEVDLIDDTLDKDLSIANSSVKLVYVPSEVVASDCWYAIVNNAPVAVASMSTVGEKSEIFATDSFRKATEALMSELGVINGLHDMGFKSLKISMPVRRIVESRVEKVKREVLASSSFEIKTMRDDIKAALATSAVGINKGFFSKLYNPIKAELYEILSNAGVRNAEVLIDDAFMAKADEYHRTLLEQSFDLLTKPVEARNEISKAVMTANYQRSNSNDDSSLSSSVSKQLGSIGTKTQPITAAQNDINPNFNQRAASVIKGLGRS